MTGTGFRVTEKAEFHSNEQVWSKSSEKVKIGPKVWSKYCEKSEDWSRGLVKIFRKKPKIGRKVWSKYSEKVKIGPKVKLSLSSLGNFHALSHRFQSEGRLFHPHPFKVYKTTLMFRDLLAEFPLLQDSLFHPENRDAINSFFAGEMKVCELKRDSIWIHSSHRRL